MNTIRNWLFAWINSSRTFWSNNNKQVKENVRRLCRGVDRVARNITRLIIIGVILNVVASYFYPDFPQRFPAIYGWFDGWLQLGEFALKIVLKGIYSLFTGHLSELWNEYDEAFRELVQQFTNWLNTLQF